MGYLSKNCRFSDSIPNIFHPRWRSRSQTSGRTLPAFGHGTRQCLALRCTFYINVNGNLGYALSIQFVSWSLFLLFFSLDCDFCSWKMRTI